MSKEPSTAEVLLQIGEMLKALNSKAPEPTDNNAKALDLLTKFLEKQDDRQHQAREREDLETKEARKLGRHVNAAGVYENNFPPDISWLNPLGERDHPRPELKCRMIYVGQELKKEGLSREECDLLNQCVPGDYFVTKADGSRIKFIIKGKFSSAGTMETMSFHFPCKGPGDRDNHAPMTAYLREVLGDKVPTPTELLAEIDRLKAQISASA